LPKEFPDDSSVHRVFQRWVELGVLDRIWAALVEECEELWAGWWTGSGRPPTVQSWARPVLGDLVGPNLTDRGKNGVIVVAGTNTVRDDKLLQVTPATPW
jgi:putative transposase